MPDWKNEIRIAAPIQKVWDTLVDYPHASEWQPGVKRATIETTRSFGSGTRIKVEFATQTTYMTVLESIPPRRLSLNLDRGGTSGTNTKLAWPSTHAARPAQARRSSKPRPASMPRARR